MHASVPSAPRGALKLGGRIGATPLGAIEAPAVDDLFELLDRPAWQRDALCREFVGEVNWFPVLPPRRASAVRRGALHNKHPRRSDSRRFRGTPAATAGSGGSPKLDDDTGTVAERQARICEAAVASIERLGWW